jgi:mRNA interferase HicA
MKKRDLETQLKKCGWWLKRNGKEHDYWTNGQIHESVPRHREVNEMTAKKILRTAKNNPPKK